MTRERYDPREGIYFLRKQISGKKDGLLIASEHLLSHFQAKGQPQIYVSLTDHFWASSAYFIPRRPLYSKVTRLPAPDESRRAQRVDGIVMPVSEKPASRERQQRRTLGPVFISARKGWPGVSLDVMGEAF
jgi:hypothetical protein